MKRVFSENRKKIFKIIIITALVFSLNVAVYAASSVFTKQTVTINAVDYQYRPQSQQIYTQKTTSASYMSVNSVTGLPSGSQVRIKAYRLLNTNGTMEQITIPRTYNQYGTGRQEYIIKNESCFNYFKVRNY